MELCRRLGLLTKASVAIDGSKFKALNNRDKNFTRGKVERRRKQLEESVARYLSQLDTADRQEPTEALAAKTAHLKEKLAKLDEEMAKLDAYEKRMLASPDRQISLTDPDSRSMATSGRGSGMVGYNVQTAVDTENHLIVAHEVTNVGHDRSQLANMAKQAKAALQADTLEAVADRGYFDGEEILACDEAGIAVTLPKPMTWGSKSEGRFGKQDFVYISRKDVYRCPAGEHLKCYFTTVERGLTLRRYWTSHRFFATQEAGEALWRSIRLAQSPSVQKNARKRPSWRRFAPPRAVRNSYRAFSRGLDFTMTRHSRLCLAIHSPITAHPSQLIEMIERYGPRYLPKVP